METNLIDGTFNLAPSLLDKLILGREHDEHSFQIFSISGSQTSSYEPVVFQKNNKLLLTEMAVHNSSWKKICEITQP